MGKRLLSAAIAAILVMIAASQAYAVQAADLAGRYDFEAVSDDGNAFTGTVLAHRDGDGYGGWILTTISEPGGIRNMEYSDSGVRMTFDVRGRDIVFDVGFEGDAFEGGWTLMDMAGPVSGKRVETNAQGDLSPIPCRLAGVRELGRCGILHVPENRDDPSGRWIPLNVHIIPATGEGASEGALFHFAGGPGQAATEGAGGNADRFGRILQTRDVVMIDQRGTGMSNPLRCSDPGPLAFVRTILAWDLPDAWISACAEALRDKADLRHYRTADAAADVEDVRQWLGYDQIDLYGGSYGTRAALEYARLYTDNVRTVTIRAVMPPSGIMAIQNPLNLRDQLEGVFSECEVDDACAGAFPNLREEYRELVARVGTGADTAVARDRRTDESVTVPIDKRVLAGSLRRMLMDANGWLSVPRAIHEAHSSDWSAIVPGIESTMAVTSSLYLGMSLSVMCAEEAPRIRNRDVRAETAGTLMAHWPAEGILNACEHWDEGEAAAGYDQPVSVEKPILILSGAQDPSTPAFWGQIVEDTAPNALHLVMEGVSHSPFPVCAQNVMTEFVRAGSLEGLDVSCIDDLQRGPFRLNQ